MKDQYNLKLIELKFNRLKNIFYFILWPFIALLTLIVGLGLRKEIDNFVVILILTIYISFLYFIVILGFARRTKKLISKVEVKKK